MRHCIDSPIARVEEPVLSAKNLELLYLAICAIPSGIHPKCFKSDSLLRDLIEKMKACRSPHTAPSQMRYRQNDRFSFVLWHVVLQDVSSQDIMCIDAIAAPRQQQDLRRSNLLTWVENEMCFLHACRDCNGPFSWTRERDSPRPGPSDRANHAASVHLNIEEGNRLDSLAAT